MQYMKDDVIKKIVDKIFDDGTKIVVGGHYKHNSTYTKKYHLKYSQKIVRTVLDYFFDVIVEILAEGDSIKWVGYMNIEPRLRKERHMKETILCDERIVPAYYAPYVSSGKFLKEACKRIEVGGENSSNENDGD